MADQRIRELEREAAQGGLDARSRLLAERLRVGELKQDDVVLAQQLGCPAALRIESPPSAALTPLRDLLNALGDRDPSLLVRALVAAGEVLLPVYRTWLPGEARCDEALEAVAAWLAEPTAEHARAAWDAAVATQGAINHTTYTILERWNIGMISRSQMTALEYVARTAHDAADAAFRVHEQDGSPQISSLLRLDEAGQQGGWLEADTIRDAIRAAVLPQVLAGR